VVYIYSEQVYERPPAQLEEDVSKLVCNTPVQGLSAVQHYITISDICVISIVDDGSSCCEISLGVALHHQAHSGARTAARMR
jgi:hypothetical protein